MSFFTRLFHTGFILLYCCAVLIISLNNCYGQTPTLQQVTSAGNTTTNNITAATIYGTSDGIFNGVTIGKGLNTATTYNISIGVAQTTSPTANASYNTAVGNKTLKINYASFQYNSALGYTTLTRTSTGSNNIGIGSTPFYSNTTGSYNSGIGTDALYANVTGLNNTGVGHFSLQNSISSENTAIGATALQRTTSGIRNTAIGRHSLMDNTIGSYNVGVGFYAMPYDNTSDGQLSIQNIIYGSNNLGYGSTISTGNIGIGVKNPSQKLEVNGKVKAVGFMLPNGSGAGKILISSDSTGNSSWSNPFSFSSNWLITASGNDIYYNTGNVAIGNGPSDINYTLAVYGNIFSSGKIVIGETNFNKVTQYSLAVNGTAIFTKAVVKLNADWQFPDYVFNRTYRLPSLKALEKDIKITEHLPQVPSTLEVKANGIDLGKNQILLLKKIEEITLLVIEHNKKAVEIREALKSQNKKIKKLETILKQRTLTAGKHQS